MSTQLEHVDSLGDPATHTFRMLIGGQLVDGARHIDVVNPATEQAIAAGPVADEAQVEQAIAAAKAAFPAWSATPVAERAAVLSAIADVVEAHADEFARLTTLEQGKPLALARGDVDSGLLFTRHFAGLRPGPQIVRDDDEARIEIHRRPVGVVAAITPWNFPFFQALYKIAPALLMGNTLVIKPAPTTPLSTLLLGELVAGVVPAGVLNVVGDDGSVGPQVTAHPDVAKVSFTGSTAVGKAVMGVGADSLKRVTLELGGNDAAIVLDDADIEKTADGLCQWAFFNAGQVCINIKRIYAADTVYDALCDAMARRVNAIKVGDGLEPDTEMGPVQNGKQYQAAQGYLKVAADTGRILAQGAIPDGPGYFVPPTLLTDIEDDNSLISEETFAPIRTILRYTDVDDAVGRANRTRYGLGSSVWGTDLERAAAVAARLESGTAWVNQHFALSPDVPFGGRKESGLGVEFGDDGLNAFTDIQVINVAKI